MAIAHPRRGGPLMPAAFSAVLLAACAAGPSSSPTPMPPATSAQEFGVAACSSLTAMSRAIGNPDTAADSVLSAALDDAIRAGDQARVNEAAARMQAELDSARSLARVARGWPPGATMGATLDRLMVAFAAFVEAKRAHAPAGPGRCRCRCADGARGRGWRRRVAGPARRDAQAAGRGSERHWRVSLLGGRGPGAWHIGHPRPHGQLTRAGSRAPS